MQRLGGRFAEGKPVHLEFIAQPGVRVGDLIESGIAARGAPREFVVVSAFASLPTVLRFKPKVAAVKASGGEARMVLGVDLGGTSQEVIKEVASWAISVTIVKNRYFGVTFHPKIYLSRWEDGADIIVGSNNLTDGGLYRNYEAASRTVYEFPADVPLYERALAELERFLRPTGPTAAELSSTYLANLLASPEIPSEADARRARGERTATRPEQNRATQVFGFELVPSAPRLPIELQHLLLAARNSQQVQFKKAVAQAKAKQKASNLVPGTPVVPLPPRPSPLAQLDPSAFYMTLVTSRGAANPTIPGEQRIPLEAIDMAEDFWGWDENYNREVSPRLGAAASEPRIYRNWRPRWRIWAADAPQDVTTHAVRMYLYENSSDFRFYLGDLVRMQAASGDIVRLRRIDEEDATYECVLARSNSPTHAEWLPFLVNVVKSGNSNRRFGFT